MKRISESDFKGKSANDGEYVLCWTQMFKHGQKIRLEKIYRMDETSGAVTD